MRCYFKAAVLLTTPIGSEDSCIAYIVNIGSILIG